MGSCSCKQPPSSCCQSGREAGEVSLDGFSDSVMEQSAAKPEKGYEQDISLEHLSDEAEKVEKVPVQNKYGDDFTDLEFDANFGDENELQDAKETKNPHEAAKNVEFSKNGIIRYIEEIHNFENPKNNGDWVLKSNTQNQKVYMKKDSNEVFLRNDCIFNQKFKIEKLI